MDPSPKQCNDHDPLSQELENACRTLTDDMFEVSLELRHQLPPTKEVIDTPCIPYGPDGKAFLSIRLAHRQGVVEHGFIAVTNPHDKRDNMFAKITHHQVTRRDGSPLPVERIVSRLDRMGPNSLLDGVTYDNTAMHNLAAEKVPTIDQLARVILDRVIPLADPHHIEHQKTYTLYRPHVEMLDMSDENVVMDPEKHHQGIAEVSKDALYLLREGRTTTFTVTREMERLLPRLTLETTTPFMYNYKAARVVVAATLDPDNKPSFEAYIKHDDGRFSITDPERCLELAAELSMDLWDLCDEQTLLAKDRLDSSDPS